MTYYRLASQDFYFPCPVPDLESFKVANITQTMTDESTIFVSSSFPGNEYPAPLALLARTMGMVSGKQCQVETWSAPPGFILKVSGGSDFYVAPDGSQIFPVNNGKLALQPNLRELTGFDQEILLGPVLVFALALRDTWSLHASAAMFRESLIIFLGESGQGKSTLADYLISTKNSNWRLVADDILPVILEDEQVSVWPHFPQLKLPNNAQPAVSLPESIPLTSICILAHANVDEIPKLEILSTAQTVQTLLGHTAGTRMFGPLLLARHLNFSVRAAEQIPAYRLTHPHRRDTLPLVKDFLEKIC